MKLDRITSNPNRMNGQSSIRNLRLTLQLLFEARIPRMRSAKFGGVCQCSSGD